jgi:hypothetical protein
MHEDATILAVSEGDDTIVEFKFNDGHGVLGAEAPRSTLYYQEEGGRLTVFLAPTNTERAGVVHKMKPGDSVIYRVCPKQVRRREAVEWQTFTAPDLPKRPLWQRLFRPV